jgi:hypothetical protein
MVDAKEKIKLAEELGFKNQVKIVRDLATQEEIARIVDGEFAREVSVNDMADHLGLRAFEKKCHILFFSGMIFFAVISTFLIVLAAKAPAHSGPEAMYGLYSAVTLIGTLICLVNGWSSQYTLIKQEVKDYEEEIPYGALLKIKEAKNKNCFNSICVVWSDKKPRQSADPLIIGFSGDTTNNMDPNFWMGRYCKAYLIYAWDLDKDRDKLKIM